MSDRDILRNAPVGDVPRAWLFMAVGQDRQHGGNEGYDDDPSSYYEFDDTVPRHSEVAVGDIAVLWDRDVLLGAGVISAIDEEDREKAVMRCPACESSSFKARKSKSPRFKCQTCKGEFEEPDYQLVSVHTYRAIYEATWTDLFGLMSGSELRALCEKPKSQHSIRPIDWPRLSAAVTNSLERNPFSLIQRAAIADSDDQGSPADGHKLSVVRARRGQAAFRRKLLAKYGHSCAVTGDSPVEVLEACHLYSYAKEGKHLDQGGLLLRRDIHRLFDLGLLTVDPKTDRISLAPSCRVCPPYAAIHGAKFGSRLSKPLTAKQRDWLRRHREQWLDTADSSPGSSSGAV